MSSCAHKGTRFFIERITKTFAMIKREEYPNARSLAEQFEVCEKTIMRDLDFLRDRMGFTLVFNYEKNGWEMDPNAKLPWWII